jgi:hypothetical protein
LVCCHSSSFEFQLIFAIGVLIKRYRITTREKSTWLPFIRDEKEPLENNSFCVKKSSSADLKANITRSQTRQMEDDFFSSETPGVILNECTISTVEQATLLNASVVDYQT